MLFCDVHDERYVRGVYGMADGNYSCCDALFHPTPFFSNFGTCYTTKEEIVETFPYVFRALQIWMIPKSEIMNYPGVEE